ncbi:flavin-containing monooxygenase [Agromyces mariniharenae]|uniref:NADPH-dependent L-lysine N(6)-monooxygenase n=1 Tax=Agromyces mariniharenae TaxID=2604423 RepID=A0A5S4V4R5_9MICO|nr:NAD(P)-binding domain-containing protein [Agromyces mariniharenae]TYL53996.1 NADPH-dependent L-lysine N(6)-monooxygenase [Agromyces mariniharenae]
MSTTTLDTVVIGAGAAGLIVGRRLAARGIRFELFDEHARVGDQWRERYRSLRLFTPRGFASLPGMLLDVGRFEYPTGTQFGDYLEQYAERFELPVRTSTRVTSLSREPDGRFRLADDDVLAEHVIVASGAHRRPVTPGFATGLDPSIRQLHSMEYRGPEQFAEGPVLVVGAANSGTDVALDAARAGHAVTLAGRHPGHVPVDIDTPIGNLASRIFLARLRRVTIDSEKGRRMRAAELGHGVMLIRNSLRDLERAGVVQAGRVRGVEAGHPVLADGTVVDATTVVWCTGSRPDLSWLRIDGVVGADGEPETTRGVVTGCPGLGFVGMEFQYSVASAALVGMDRDAAIVVDALFGDAADRVEPAVPATHEDAAEIAA